MRHLVLALFLSLALGGLARASGFEVFVNNRPFQGSVSGPAADVLLEAEPYFQQVGGEFRYDPVAGKATLDGKELPVHVSGGKVFVRARDLVERVGGRYTDNAAMGTVDIYAFDPIEASRKAWRSLMSRGTVRTPADLETMDSLARTTLTRKLGMTLEFTVRLALVTPAEMGTVTGNPNTRFVVQWWRRSDRNFIQGATILLREGMRPQEAMFSLASCWGTLWAVRQGHNDGSDRSLGFGFWAANYVLLDAGTRIDVAYEISNQPGGQQEEFKRLRALERAAGPEAVLQDMIRSAR